MFGSKFVCWAALSVALAGSAYGQAIAQTRPETPLAAIQARNRIQGRIDDTRWRVLQGQRHPMATAQNSRGPVGGDLAMEHMVLVLHGDTAQEEALEELLRGQQDPHSAEYHHWLTPDVFGEHFGASASDLEQITNWLRMHGFEVEEISASRRAITFSGTAGQVEEAFHTPIQKYVVRGEQHYANAQDPEIPESMASVVGGVLSLHDFRSAPMAVKTQFTAGGGLYFLSPKDWSTIYDVTPLYGHGVNGAGQSIAVIGRTDIALSDVRGFRNTFGLPANDPQVIVNGADPGTNSNDQVESSLDVEWAGAIAPNAAVKFVTSKSGSTDGVYLSAQYAVNQNLAQIVTVSYGACEKALGSSGNAFWNNLWAQAAAQGMTVLVSSGDSGAAGCDSSSAKSAANGRGVNGLCSSPYSTCVGGTEFKEGSNYAQYWAASNDANGGSALGYIPETAWNESASGGLWASGGGVSTVYSKPSWQAAPGIPADGMRDVPDVAMSGASHDAYIIQMNGGMYCVGGTSAAAPSFASLMALVVQAAHGAQGNANPVLYRLASQQLSAGGAAVFHDTTSGNNSVPGVTGFSSGTGYDLATGLGSVDGSMLVNQWGVNNSTGFTIAANASSATLGQGGTASVTLSLTAQGGFNSAATLTASGLPAGVSAKLSATSVKAGAPVTVTLTATSSAAPGTYAVTFSGSGAGVTATTKVSLTVVAPSFALGTSAGSASVAQGGSAAVTLTSSVVNGFKAAVALTVSGLPKGLTASFAPATIASPGSGSSKLTLTAASTLAKGTYNLTVTAASGGVTHTQVISLTVTGH